MYLSLKGRTILVTGASRGIGHAVALECASAGARLALTGRDMGALQETLEQARALGAEAKGYLLDVCEYGKVATTVGKVLDDFGRVDALVNNAAVGKYGGFLDLSIDDWKTMLATNIIGLVAVIQAVLPAMLGRGQGHIVNVSSVQGLPPPRPPQPIPPQSSR